MDIGRALMVGNVNYDFGMRACLISRYEARAILETLSRGREKRRRVAPLRVRAIRDLASLGRRRAGGNRNPKSLKRDVFVVSFALSAPCVMVIYVA